MIDLQIQQQFGRIGIKITPYKFDLNIRPADLEIQQLPAEIDQEQPAATLEIDYTPALESLGYCGIAAQQQVFNQEAQDTCDAGTARRVLEEEQFGNLKDKANVARIVTQASQPRNKELKLVSIQPIRVTVKENPVRGMAATKGVYLNFTSGSVQGEFQYGSAHCFMEQNPYIKFHAVGSIIDDQK